MYNIGFLGFGEAAYHIACGFSKLDNVKCFAFDVTLKTEGERRNILEKRLAETGVEKCSSEKELLENAENIFLIIPAKFAKGAALTALPFMTENHLFCDLTTNKPEIKSEIGRAFEEKGAKYADASVMGAVPIYQHATPTLVSGNGAEEMVEKLVPLGMKLTYVGKEAGKAVKMKLTRSIFVKGVEALTLEMLMTAKKLGIEEEIVQGVEDSFAKLGFKGFCGQLVISGVQHSERRSLECIECAELEESLGIDSKMMRAAGEKLSWYTDLGYMKQSPLPDCKSLEDVYELWEKSGTL